MDVNERDDSNSDATSHRLLKFLPRFDVCDRSDCHSEQAFFAQ